MTKLRKSFRKEFVKKLAREYDFEFKMFEEELWKNGLGNILYSEEYCTQCYDDDKMFRGKILVEIICVGKRRVDRTHVKRILVVRTCIKS